MTDFERRDDEPLLPGLGPVPVDAWDVPELPDALRAAILSRTVRVVRRRRRTRRLGFAAAAVVLFSVGVVSGVLVSRTTIPEGGPETEVTAASRTARAPLPADPRDAVARIEAASPAERSTLLREAGDEYLTPARADPAAALHCYRRLLASADVGTEPHRDTDSWLLSYLKLARR